VSEQTTTETRTVHFTIDPALRAYLAWLDAEGLAFSLPGFDVFAAGYRANEAEGGARDTDAADRAR
jgi:hypothetical protein